MLKTPAQQPVANAIGERVIGTLRRECLDLVMPLHERHLYGILKKWVTQNNERRPHMPLGPGLPKPRRTLPVPRQAHRHRMPTDQRVVARPVIGGLHHAYQVAQKAA